MTPEKFQQVEELFFQARQQPSATRFDFLRSTCPDSEIRREVERLLAVDHRAESMDSLHDRLFSGAPAPDHTEDLSGRQVGPYEFTQMIARGGMGVVYRAVDKRLGRNVAVKALPSKLVQDPARRSRLVREAKILASLSHPNVATVFGLEQEEAADFLVMEYVEGETLHQRLRRGAMPIEDALGVGASIAAGLEAAHEAGVIHRDLKPANVMFTPDNRVKVLDFGLAREMPDEAERQAHGPHAPQVTREGVILGTPGYMSPEQARGHALDRRTDVFSFGCVLFECLSGKVAFDGQSQADIIAAVLEREPDWTSLPSRTPPNIRTMLRRCLTKNPSQRLRDMGDIRLELEEALRERAWTGPSSTSWTVPGAAPPRRSWLGWVTASVGVIALVAASFGGAVLFRPSAAVAPPTPLKRFQVPFPQVQFDLSRVRLSLTRSGGHMVYSAVGAPDGPTQLWLHEFDRGVAQPLAGTEQGWMPFLSPDGEWIGFFDDGVLRKRRVQGGETLNVVETFSWFGASWGNQGKIAFVPYWNKPIATVSDQGGDTTSVTRFRPEKNDLGHMLPCLTRDGRGLLFAVWRGREEIGIDYVDLTSNEQHTVVERGCTPKLANTPYGEYLLWERRGSVFAAKWDAAARRITGPETAVADGVLVDLAFFTACYDAADDGTFAYVAGPRYNEESRLAWLEEGQDNRPFNSAVQPFAEPRFSADGDKLSVILKGAVYQGYLYDIPRGTFTRISSEHDCTSACVSPDGKTVAYASNRGGRYGLILRSLETGQERQLVPPERDQTAHINWTPDGRQIVFAMSPDLDSVRDLWAVTVDAAPVLRQITNTAEEESYPRVSPNGKWLAFCSTATGNREVYVSPFDNPTHRRQLSFEGGNQPEWSPDGTTLYFISGGKLMRVPFDPEGGAATRTAAIRSLKRFGQSDFEVGDYGVAPDGRILVVEPSPKRTSAASVNVILNWHELLPEAKAGPVK